MQAGSSVGIVLQCEAGVRRSLMSGVCPQAMGHFMFSSGILLGFIHLFFFNAHPV